MSNTEQVMESLVVHNQIHDPEGNIAAVNGTMQGMYGLQVVCVGDIESTKAELSFDKLNVNPDATNFYGQWFYANLAKSFSRHVRFRGLARQLGFNAFEESVNGRDVLVATIPAGAEYLNNALDDIPRHRGFRFYDYDFDSGNIPGTDYLQGVADGFAPVAPFGRHTFGHDMFDHVLGYAMLGNRATRRMQTLAQRAIEDGVDANPDGKLVYGSPAAMVAEKIDSLSGELTRPLVYREARYDLRSRLSMTVATGQLAFNGRRV